MESSEDMGEILVGANLKYYMKSFEGIDGAEGPYLVAYGS